MATMQAVTMTATTVQASFVLDAELAWRQVQTRDAAGDGVFVYAVESTGVFCRPSCPSRRPARRHVRFYADADAALAAGYRACRRCHPAGEHAEAETVRGLCAYLDRNLDRVVTLQELGRLTGMSHFTVQRMFERVLGVSPRGYQIERRSAQLRDQLAEGRSVTHAIYEAGFSSSSRMYDGAQERLGMRPERFRRGGLGEQIRFLVADCPLGQLLVAATERGLCMVALGDDRAALEQELRGRFPAAAIQQATDDDERLGAPVRALLASMTEHPVAFDLPLDLRATAFEQRVWRLLRTIPRGETRSYSAVAAELGQPRAVRAVARACARNPLALVVPCHRVVGKSGQLTGYRWGTARKQRLLELERAAGSAGGAGGSGDGGGDGSLPG
jgi:AraC family transcriptional regulator, regulatory protein of adaptative response / methylated-DNA-[protein]-cysteine methyltransferase